ncbi:MAG TPA: sigma-70 family RNA polymerase sigma factor [Roseiflexaceae bacterium]|nr:sigma-70 family RNA polymerase sigma factor [Roseiflexaceae bacterium]
MSAPTVSERVAALPVPAQATYAVLCALLPPDTPRPLTTAELAELGGLAPGHVAASLAALECVGLIWRNPPRPGQRGMIARLSSAAPGATPALVEEEPPVDTPREPLAVAMRAFFQQHPRGTILTLSNRALADRLGRSFTGQVCRVLNELIAAGVVERLSKRPQRLRVGAGAVAPVETTLTTRALVERFLTTYPPGTELRVTAREIAAQIGRSMGGVVGVLQTLEAEGAIRRTILPRGALLTVLGMPDAPASPAPPPPPPPVPAPVLASRPDRPTPHAALWEHLLATQPRHVPINWLLAGVTVERQADATLLRCTDAARLDVAEGLRLVLVAALRALGLPDTLLVEHAPAAPAPAELDAVAVAAVLVDPVRAMMTAVRPVPKLAEVEARALLVQVQAGHAAAERRAALLHRSPELAAALEQAVARGQAAWEQLVLAQLRLVMLAAWRVPAARLPLAERVQIGVLAVMQALARPHARPDRSIALLAYRAAYYGILAAVRDDRPIRLPTTSSQVTQAQTDLRAALGREPTAVEIATTTGMRPATVAALLAADAPTASLDAPVRADNTRTLGAALVGTEPTPEARLVAAETLQALRTALAALSPRERQVIALRFGLRGAALGVGEVAKRLGWSAARVRAVEVGALGRMRERMGAEATTF